MSKQKDFVESEAQGKIKSLAEIPTMPEIIEDIPAILENPNDFSMAIGEAQMAGREYLEVSEKLFKYLVKNNPTNYLTYGNPGIKVFKQGTRGEILKEEKMSAEQYHIHIVNKNRAASGNG